VAGESVRLVLEQTVLEQAFASRREAAPDKPRRLATQLAVCTDGIGAIC
jgi:hypothetical protein